MDAKHLYDDGSKAYYLWKQLDFATHIFVTRRDGRSMEFKDLYAGCEDLRKIARIPDEEIHVIHKI